MVRISGSRMRLAAPNGLGRFAHAFALRFDPITHELHQAQL